MRKEKKPFVSQMGKLAKVTNAVVLVFFGLAVGSTVFLVYKGLLYLT